MNCRYGFPSNVYVSNNLFSAVLNRLLSFTTSGSWVIPEIGTTFWTFALIGLTFPSHPSLNSFALILCSFAFVVMVSFHSSCSHSHFSFFLSSMANIVVEKYLCMNLFFICTLSCPFHSISHITFGTRNFTSCLVSSFLMSGSNALNRAVSISTCTLSFFK